MGLDSLVDGLRASGHPVVSSEVGAPQPLPPELEVVAFRVLQEMLTNAIRHGRSRGPGAGGAALGGRAAPGGPQRGRRGADPAAAPRPAGRRRGHGLEGMRRRLEAVGGRLDVRRRQEADEATFTATAWVPVRAR